VESFMKVANCGGAIRVLLADSNQTQCQLLASALRRQPGLNVSSCRSELAECLDSVEAVKPDVLLVGASIPENSYGLLDLVRTVRSSFPKVAIVVLLNAPEREIVVSALRAGVRGLFSLAAQPFKALCKCIHAVHKGQYWTSTEQTSFLIEALSQTVPVSVVDSKGNALLTPRENQVVRLVAEGLSNRAAARELKISENSIKKTLLRIYDKLGISNRVELVLYAVAQRSVVGPGSQIANTTTANTAAVVRPIESSPRHTVVERPETVVVSYRAS
jgi:DNA-binding NarL/FixJ family response regulator